MPTKATCIEKHDFRGRNNEIIPQEVVRLSCLSCFFFYDGHPTNTKSISAFWVGRAWCAVLITLPGGLFHASQQIPNDVITF